MSAVRLMSASDFYDMLSSHGFEKTDETIGSNDVWIHIKTGIHVTVARVGDELVPDWLINDYLQAVGKLYHVTGDEKITDKQYEVTKKKPMLSTVK